MYDFDLDYEHDFSFLNAGEQFPNKRMLAKNAEYKFRRKQYGGKYGNGRNMIVMINKIDALPYFNFDLEKCRKSILFRNSHATIIPISAYNGNGIDEVLKRQFKNWLILQYNVGNVQFATFGDLK
jgi:hypothetical protein